MAPTDCKSLTMADNFKDRLKVESDDLGAKLEKLNNYIARGFPVLQDAKQIELLRRQQVVMTDYLNILSERLTLLA